MSTGNKNYANVKQMATNPKIIMRAAKCADKRENAWMAADSR